VAQKDVFHRELGCKRDRHLARRVPSGFERPIDNVVESGEQIVAQLVFDKTAGSAGLEEQAGC